MVLNTKEYIEALSAKGTWFSTMDLKFLAECFKIRITVLDLYREANAFVDFDNIIIGVHGRQFKDNVVIR